MRKNVGSETVRIKNLQRDSIHLRFRPTSHTRKDRRSREPFLGPISLRQRPSGRRGGGAKGGIDASEKKGQRKKTEKTNENYGNADENTAQKSLLCRTEQEAKGKAAEQSEKKGVLCRIPAGERNGKLGDGVRVPMRGGMRLGGCEEANQRKVVGVNSWQTMGMLTSGNGGKSPPNRCKKENTREKDIAKSLQKKGGQNKGFTMGKTNQHRYYISQSKGGGRQRRNEILRNAAKR